MIRDILEDLRDYDLEAQVLSIACYLDTAIVVNRCSDKDFYHPETKATFKAIQKIVTDGKIPDPNLIAEAAIEIEPNLKAAAIIDMVNTPIQYDGIPAIDKLKELSAKRQIVTMLHNQGQELKEKDSAAVVENIKEALNNYTLNTQTLSNIDIYSPYTLDDLQSDVRETPAGLKTGYKSLDEILTIPQEAITLIAGRPSHGKTSFMLNMLLNMAEEYTDKTFVFFSYEQTKKQVALRLLNIFSKYVIDENRNMIELENYIRDPEKKIDQIDLGKEAYTTLIGSGRVIVVDVPFFVEDLKQHLGYLKENYSVGAVFIDYMQKVKIKNRYSTRQIELQKISECVLETALDLKLPIILGAQLGRDKDRHDKVRLDNIRECGDLEQDADTVIGLYNAAMEKAQEDGIRPNNIDVDLTLSILKNRNGLVNEEVNLLFKTPILTIEDPKDRVLKEINL